eukprot:10850209-Ditylum_brightwellii.AAC.1
MASPGSYALRIFWTWDKDSLMVLLLTSWVWKSAPSIMLRFWYPSFRSSSNLGISGNMLVVE